MVTAPGENDTHVSLREYIDSQLDAHRDVHHLEAEALALARAEIDRRLAGMNELRSQIDRERGTFVTMIAYDAYRDALGIVLDAHKTRIQSLEGRFYAIILLASLLGGVIGHYAGKLLP